MRLYGTKTLTDRSGAWTVLERGAKEYWGVSGLPAVEREPGGKPRFSGDTKHQFNLSHSGAFALCVLDDAPVGVDIQIVKTNWRESLPRRVCSGEELTWLEGQPDRWAAFTLLWSMKESRVKQSGLGLRMSIPAIRVPLPQEGRSLYRLDGLWFRLYTGEGWAACVCGEQEPPEDIVWL